MGQIVDSLVGASLGNIMLHHLLFSLHNARTHCLYETWFYFLSLFLLVPILLDFFLPQISCFHIYTFSFTKFSLREEKKKEKMSTEKTDVERYRS
jgi:hypothetical protein